MVPEILDKLDKEYFGYRVVGKMCSEALQDRKNQTQAPRLRLFREEKWVGELDDRGGERCEVKKISNATKKYL